ncbi:MAG: SH3 domain-containing protein, partial [Anaerolineales bacterium]
MLTPFGYYKIRLIDAVRKRRSTLIFFVFCMFFAGIIFFIPPSQYGEAAGDVSHLSIGNVSPQDPLLAVEVVERKQSPTPTFPLRLTPTLLPVSNTGVIWSSQGDGAYLWDSPDGSILTMLPNGRVVKFLGERQVYGNVHWVKIQNASGEGWLSWSHIHRVSDLPVAYVADEKWTYLRDRPRGKV